MGLATSLSEMHLLNSSLCSLKNLHHIHGHYCMLFRIVCSLLPMFLTKLEAIYECLFCRTEKIISPWHNTESTSVYYYSQSSLKDYWPCKFLHVNSVFPSVDRSYPDVPGPSSSYLYSVALEGGIDVGDEAWEIFDLIITLFCLP